MVPRSTDGRCRWKQQKEQVVMLLNHTVIEQLCFSLCVFFLSFFFKFTKKVDMYVQLCGKSPPFQLHSIGNTGR